MASSSTVTQPNTTLYINNINDQVHKDELRQQLFALFTTYGKIVDVVASKTPKMRGQAFLVFTDLAAATSALRATDGMLFYDKPLRVQYAKTKSYATLRREDPNFVPPTSVHGRTLTEQQLKPNGATAAIGATSAQKRTREDEDIADARASKQKKSDDDDDSDDEEMEIDDDEDGPAQGAGTSGTAATTMPQTVERPSARLLCTNLPGEVTDSVLSVLFQQYQGFQSTQVAPVPAANAAGQRGKMAQVLFDTPELASVAKEALDGFTLKKGWQMTVAFV